MLAAAFDDSPVRPVARERFEVAHPCSRLLIKLRTSDPKNERITSESEPQSRTTLRFRLLSTATTCSSIDSDPHRSAKSKRMQSEQNSIRPTLCYELKCAVRAKSHLCKPLLTPLLTKDDHLQPATPRGSYAHL